MIRKRIKNLTENNKPVVLEFIQITIRPETDAGDGERGGEVHGGQEARRGMPLVDNDASTNMCCVSLVKTISQYHQHREASEGV